MKKIFVRERVHKKMSNYEKEKLHLKQKYVSKLTCEKKIVKIPTI